jgi:hypothetical protein
MLLKMSTYHIVGNIGAQKEGRGLETEKGIQEEQDHFLLGLDMNVLY